jgi:exodeoxyribonuclease-1
LFRNAQPRLWDYALKLRDKRFAGSLLDPLAMTPLLHVSQRYPASRMSAAPVLPLARHPRIDGRVIVFDLASEPDALLDLDAETILARLYLRREQLGDGVERIALKEVHLNKCPALVAWEHLRPADFERLGIDVSMIENRAVRLRSAGPALAEKLRLVYAAEREHERPDVDAGLYDGFIDDADRRLFPQVRSTPPEALGLAKFAFRDPRLPELLFRYRARNWPETLAPGERARWNDYRRERLLAESGMSESTLPAFFAEIDGLRGEHAGDPAKLALLERLEAWGRGIEASLR